MTAEEPVSFRYSLEGAHGSFASEMTRLRMAYANIEIARAVAQDFHGWLDVLVVTTEPGRQGAGSIAVEMMSRRRITGTPMWESCDSFDLRAPTTSEELRQNRPHEYREPTVDWSKPEIVTFAKIRLASIAAREKEVIVYPHAPDVALPPEYKRLDLEHLLRRFADSDPFPQDPNAPCIHCGHDVLLPRGHSSEVPHTHDCAWATARRVCGLPINQKGIR